VLVVDDDDDCIQLLRLALKRADIKEDCLAIVRDGAEAVAYLQGEGKFADRQRYPFPVLVLLDLKMPRMDGFQVLRWIRKESAFWYMPVVVLTASSLGCDIWKAYAEGANSFMVKGLSVDELAGQVKSVIDHWVGFSLTPGPQDVPPPPNQPPA
jgi:CheY-like chemotaxis protein